MPRGRSTKSSVNMSIEMRPHSTREEKLAQKYENPVHMSIKRYRKIEEKHE